LAFAFASASDFSSRPSQRASRGRFEPQRTLFLDLAPLGVELQTVRHGLAPSCSTKRGGTGGFRAGQESVAPVQHLAANMTIGLLQAVRLDVASQARQRISESSGTSPPPGASRTCEEEGHRRAPGRALVRNAQQDRERHLAADRFPDGQCSLTPDAAPLLDARDQRLSDFALAARATCVSLSLLRIFRRGCCDRVDSMTAYSTRRFVVVNDILRHGISHVYPHWPESLLRWWHERTGRTPMPDVGLRIRKAMEDKGLPEAARGGHRIKQPVISRLVLGKVRPRLDVLTPIAKALGVSVEYLATGLAQAPPSEKGPAADRMPLSLFLELHGDELTGHERRLLENWINREPSASERPVDFGTERDWLALVQLLREEFPSKAGRRPLRSSARPSA